jgi:hypothetical protein
VSLNALDKLSRNRLIDVGGGLRAPQDRFQFGEQERARDHRDAVVFEPSYHEVRCATAAAAERQNNRGDRRRGSGSAALVARAVPLLVGNALRAVLRRPGGRLRRVEPPAEQEPCRLRRSQGTHAVPEDAERCGLVPVVADRRQPPGAGILALRRASASVAGLQW